jgi:hypothetical protein
MTRTARNNAPTLKEKIDFKTVITNVSAFASQQEHDAFLDAARSLPIEKMNELYRFVVSVARHGFQEGQR